MNVGSYQRRISLIINMMVFTCVGCDNISSSAKGHFGFERSFIASDSLVSYIDYTSSNDNNHSYAIMIGI